MKRFTLVTTIGIVLVSCSAANALIVFQDDFNSYADQTAFTTAWLPIGCQGQGSPCTLNATSTTSNELNAADFGGDPAHLQTTLNHSPAAPSPGTADFAERNQITFPASPTVNVGDKLAFSFDFYDIAPTASPFREFMNLQSSLAVGTSPAGQLVSMGLNNNQTSTGSGGQYYMARILGFSNPIIDPDGGPAEAIAATNYIKLNDHDPTPTDTVADGPGARGTVAGWHNLKVEISTPNGADTDFNFFVDGVHAEHVNVVGSSPRTYSAIRMGAGVSSTNDAYFDNVKVEYIAGAVGVAGDYNGDSKVDAADYVLWRANPAGHGGDPAGYTTWRNNFGLPGAGAGLSTSGVPEPMTLGLVLVGLAASAVGRRDRKI